MLFHQHSTLLKHYGFKRVHKQSGTNPVNPAKISVLTSTWEHKKLGQIFINHSAHVFTYSPLGATPDENTKVQPIGKNNSFLKQFLEQMFVSTAEEGIAIDFPQKVSSTLEQKQKMHFFGKPLLPKKPLPDLIVGKPVTEKEKSYLEQQAVLAQQLIPKKIDVLTPLTKKALDDFFDNTSEPKKVPHVDIHSTMAALIDKKFAATPKITAPEIPAILKQLKLVPCYTHHKYANINYEFDPVENNFKSTQGKTFSISTVKWMVDQQYLMPSTELELSLALDTQNAMKALNEATIELTKQYQPKPIEISTSGHWKADDFKAFLAQLKHQQKADFTDKFEFLGSAANLGGAHSKYLLKDKATGHQCLFKPAKTIAGTKASLLAYADKLASDIGYLLRPETHVPVFIGTMNIPEVGKVFGSFQPMLEDCLQLSSYGPETLKNTFEGKLIPQVQQEHVIDWLISNHDAHSKHFLIKDELLYGIDKTQSYKFFPDDQLSKTYHPNTQESAPYYNAFFSSGIQENPSCIYDIVNKAKAISDDAFKQILAPYAAARYHNVEDANLFLHTACQRKKNLKLDLEKFYGTEIKPPVKPIVVTKSKSKLDEADKLVGAEPMVNALLKHGYKFKGFGNKTHYPKYKDSDGKTVYLIDGDGWEYYPMGSSTMNPYGSNHGKGLDKLVEALSQPFEKPDIPEPELHHTTSQWSGEDADKFHALPKLTTTPPGYTTGGDPVKHITVTGSFTGKEISTITSYKGSGFVSINQFLYLGQEAHGGNYLAEQVAHLNSALAKSKTNKNLVLWRGLQGSYSDEVRKQLLSGAKILQPNSFQSCSTSQNFSHNWSGSHAHSPKVVLRITLPAGTPAVAPNSVTAMYQSEKELILSHTVIFEVQGLYQHNGALYADVHVSQHKPASEEVIEKAIEEQGEEELAVVSNPEDSKSWKEWAGSELEELNLLTKKVWVEPVMTKAGTVKSGYFKTIKTKKKV